jgi:hypothetical protein
MSADRLRFVLVVMHGAGGQERHALPPEITDAPETLCGLPRPGAWSTSGFTSRVETEIECSGCRNVAGLLVADMVGPG